MYIQTKILHIGYLDFLFLNLLYFKYDLLTSMQSTDYSVTNEEFFMSARYNCGQTVKQLTSLLKKI